MQYLLIIAHDDAFEPGPTLVADTLRWVADMQALGVRRDGKPLRPPSDAKTVRVRQGRAEVTPGPFAGGNEQICAYDLLDCASLDEAVQLALRHPMASVAAIEVRPVWENIAD